jgi:hypothetical protein
MVISAPLRPPLDSAAFFLSPPFALSPFAALPAAFGAAGFFSSFAMLTLRSFGRFQTASLRSR